MDAAVVIRAGLLPLTTLHFNSSHEDDIRAVLAQKKSEAPALFNHLPCVLDLGGLNAQQLSLQNLLQLCSDNGLLAVGVRNSNSDWQDQIVTLGLADLGKGGNRKTPKDTQVTTTAVPEIQAETTAIERAIKVHTGNVRSGQQLYTDGDLIILGMVSAGAEVLATGDIHIYGALRGRALAGVKGEQSAVIACQQFDAELVAIAGQYRLFETPPDEHQKTVVVRLTDGNLNITCV